MTQPLWLNAGPGELVGSATIATNGTVSLVGHGLTEGQPIMVANRSGGATAAFELGTVYYVTDPELDPDEFFIAYAPGGPIVTPGSSGGMDVHLAVPAYDAVALRRSMAGLLFGGVTDRLGRRAGVFPTFDAPVSVSGSTVTVHDSNMAIYPGLSSQDAPYIVHFVTHQHTLDPADGSNPRVDIVVARVYDDDLDASGRREAVAEVVTGAPAPDPDPPATPTGALLLATVDVPAGGSPSPSLDYVAPLTVAAGGVLPVRDDSEGPTSGRYHGMVRYNRDTDTLQVWTGSAWVPIGQPSGWETLVDEEISANTEFDIPSSTYDMVRVHLRGRLDDAGEFIQMQVNNDFTTDLHEKSYVTINPNNGVSGNYDDSVAENGTDWQIARWSANPGNVAWATIFGTDANQILSYVGEGYQQSASTAFRRRTLANGQLGSARLLSSLRISGTSGSVPQSTRVIIEGHRPLP